MGDSKSLTHDDLLKIVKLLESSSEFSEFRLRYGDFELHLSKHGVLSPSFDAPARTVDVQAKSSAHRESSDVAEGISPTTPAQTPTTPYAEGAVVVKSPMVGTCYLGPEPGAPTFVQTGKHVNKGQPLCIIEVMKLMNSIIATHSGVVTHILVTDAQPVGFDQDLFVIEPEA